METQTKTCPEPGVYRGIPFEEYQQWDALNPSLVKLARDSMYAFRYTELNPDHADTEAMALGRAVHVCVLEPDAFPLRYVVWDGGRKYGGKWDAFKDANAGRSIISADDYRNACDMRDSVRSHPAASKLFTVPCDIETCLVWDEPATGLRCKGRFDYLGERLFDLKNTWSLSDRIINNAVSAYGYHISMAAYHCGLWQLLHKAIEPVLLFVCTKRPFECAVRPFSEAALQRGVELWHELLGKIKECRETGIWPGFADEEVPLDLPAWEMGDGEGFVLTIGNEAMEAN